MKASLVSNKAIFLALSMITFLPNLPVTRAPAHFPFARIAWIDRISDLRMEPGLEKSLLDVPKPTDLQQTSIQTPLLITTSSFPSVYRLILLTTSSPTLLFGWLIPFPNPLQILEKLSPWSPPISPSRWHFFLLEFGYPRRHRPGTIWR